MQEEVLNIAVREMCKKALEYNLEVYGSLLVVLKRLLDRRHSKLDNSKVAAHLELPLAL